MSTTGARDHGGGLDAAIASYGGARADWLDLSTGINPCPYPVGDLAPDDWSALPDVGAVVALEKAARAFWNIPDHAAVLAAPGASALIARLPLLHATPGKVRIDTPTYNEHEAAFRAHGWRISADCPDARVVVHPNNPTGAFWDGTERAGLTIIDESFCDCTPDESRVAQAGPGVVILKSFGKFWGLAGLRLGFAIGDPDTLTRLAEMLGPWAVAGPALRIGTRALSDTHWAEATRKRLRADAAQLDLMCQRAGLRPLGGTDLFRLYDTADAAQLHDHLAHHQVLGRIFPYSRRWLRLGLPGSPEAWDHLAHALAQT